MKDWMLSASAVDRVLRRAASYKPIALQELQRRGLFNTRIEIEIGALLQDFCDQANLSLTHQIKVEDYRFDFCIAGYLLIEVDEYRHKIDPDQRKRDQAKNFAATRNGYKLLRVAVPVHNAARLFGRIMWILNDRERTMPQRSEVKSAVLTSAGVITAQDFAIFQNHGYQGLYNGLTAAEIRRKKGLTQSQHILDHMGTTELAANLFRSTQAEEKLRRDNIQGKENANQVHYQAGVIVRRAIEELGGTMPEDLPTVESIKKLEQAEKKKKRLTDKSKGKKA